jgi:hypothetical protein
LRLPNGENASVDLRKLEDYCLNPQHPHGRHKARVFSAALGWTREHAIQLRSALLEAAATNEATPGKKDDYGQRYTIDFTTHNVAIRSIWILPTGAKFAHLITCFVK